MKKLTEDEAIALLQDFVMAMEALDKRLEAGPVGLSTYSRLYKAIRYHAVKIIERLAEVSHTDSGPLPKYEEYAEIVMTAIGYH